VPSDYSGVESDTATTAATKVNHYWGSTGKPADATKPSTLDCKATAITATHTGDVDPTYSSQWVYIYGNSLDIDITSSTAANGKLVDANLVKLRVNSVSTPYAKFTGYSWKVQT